MNFTTDLPKQDPICSYLVATGKVDDECYRMHVVVNSQEYNKVYRKSEVLKYLKSNMNSSITVKQEKDKQKLLPEDRVANTARIILCHIIKISDKAKEGRRSRRKNKSRRRGASKSYARQRSESEDSQLEMLSDHEEMDDEFDDHQPNQDFS